MFAWGQRDLESARAALDALPGVRPDMMETVRADLAQDGPGVLFSGPIRGVPYKIYAVEWGGQGGGLAGFLAYTLPARLLRFLLVTALAGVLRRSLLKRLSLAACRTLHLVLWGTFYAWYFHVMGS